MNAKYDSTRRLIDSKQAKPYLADNLNFDSHQQIDEISGENEKSIFTESESNIGDDGGP